MSPAACIPSEDKSPDDPEDSDPHQPDHGLDEYPLPSHDPRDQYQTTSRASDYLSDHRKALLLYLRELLSIRLSDYTELQRFDLC